MTRAKNWLEQYAVIGTTVVTLALSGSPTAADDQPERSEAAKPAAAPLSLNDLRVIESKAVLTARRVFPAVVGVNNSAGVIVSKNGHVLTAAHLGGLRQDSVTVRLHNGKNLKVKTLGMYGERDAAAIRVEGDAPLPFVELGSTGELKAGDWCLLFGHGRPAVADRPAVLRLARIREVTSEKLVTDCTATGGDSGGPLFDLDGRLIGVNSYGLPARLSHVPVEIYRDNWERLLRGERWGGSPRIVQTIRLGPGALPRLMPPPADRGQGLVRPLAKNSAARVVRVLCDGKETCLGTVVSEGGLIATKASELSGAVTCRLAGGEELAARHVRTVERHDLAFLRVETKDLVPIPWAESKHLEIGRWVVTPGPAGELRGVGVIGVAEFAVPLDISKLGAQFGTDTIAPAGVRAVTARGPAAGAGLHPGDTITAVDGQETPTLGGLFRQLISRPASGNVKLHVTRGEESLEIEVRLAAPSGPRIVRRGPGGGAAVVIAMPRAGRAPASKRQNGFPRVFQHDALVQPSDCGSPLVGLDGKAFGINIARVSGPAVYGLPAQIIVQEIDRLSDTKSSAEPEQKTRKSGT